MVASPPDIGGEGSLLGLLRGAQGGPPFLGSSVEDAEAERKQRNLRPDSEPSHSSTERIRQNDPPCPQLAGPGTPRLRWLSRNWPGRRRREARADGFASQGGWLVNDRTVPPQDNGGGCWTFEIPGNATRSYGGTGMQWGPGANRANGPRPATGAVVNNTEQVANRIPDPWPSTTSPWAPGVARAHVLGDTVIVYSMAWSCSQ